MDGAVIFTWAWIGIAGSVHLTTTSSIFKVFNSMPTQSEKYYTIRIIITLFEPIQTQKLSRYIIFMVNIVQMDNLHLFFSVFCKGKNI